MFLKKKCNDVFVYDITLHLAYVDIRELLIELICHGMFIGSFIISCPLGIYIFELVCEPFESIPLLGSFMLYI